MIQNLSDENGNISEESTKNLVQFIRLAREDLDVQEKMTAEAIKLFDAAIMVTQSEGEIADPIINILITFIILYYI